MASDQILNDFGSLKLSMCFKCFVKEGQDPLAFLSVSPDPATKSFKPFSEGTHPIFLLVPHPPDVKDSLMIHLPTLTRHSSLVCNRLPVASRVALDLLIPKDARILCHGMRA